MAQRLFRKAALGSLSLVFGTFMVAQQSRKLPGYDDLPILHQAQTKGKSMLPPNADAPRPKRLSAPRVEQEIQKRIKTNPAMATANVTARVNDNSVVLTGTVDSSRQHDLALLIAHSWAGQRKVVDQIKRRM